jgi:hypothetical protein
MEMVEWKVPLGVLHYFTSAFADTGENLSSTPSAASERQMKLELVPFWIRPLRPAILFTYQARRLVSGFHRHQSFTCSIHTQQRPEHSTVFQIEKPTALWHWRRG